MDFNDPNAVYCWENCGCGKRLLRILDGKRTADIFVDGLFYEVDNEEVDLPDDVDLLTLPVYGTYNRQFASETEYELNPDNDLDTYTPVGPRLSTDEVKALFAQKAYGKLYE
jgi:hypothetical protein